MTEPPRPSGEQGPDPISPAKPAYTMPGETPGDNLGGGTPAAAPSSGAGGYTIPGGAPEAPSSGAGGYTIPGGAPEAPSSGAGYAPPAQSSGAGYAPPAQSSGAGGYPTYPSQQQAYGTPDAGYGPAGAAAGYGTPGYGTPGFGAPPGAYGVQPGGFGAPGAYGPPPQGYPSSDDKTYVMIAHWGGVAGVFFGAGWLGWIGPLIAFLAKGDTSPVVRAHGVSALNFHITWAIAQVVSWMLVAITCGLLFFVPFVVLMIPLIIGIIGAVKATGGEYYRYPMSIPIIK